MDFLGSKGPGFSGARWKGGGRQPVKSLGASRVFSVFLAEGSETLTGEGEFGVTVCSVEHSGLPALF